jgi:hypothetical protein
MPCLLLIALRVQLENAERHVDRSQKKPKRRRNVMADTGHQRTLLVVDVQNEYVTGKLFIEYPPPLVTSLANIAKAIDAASNRNVQVVVATQVLD